MMNTAQPPIHLYFYEVIASHGHAVCDDACLLVSTEPQKIPPVAIRTVYNLQNLRRFPAKLREILLTDRRNISEPNRQRYFCFKVARTWCLIFG